MYLVIAEKPSVSQAIARVIGAYKRKEGYLEGSDCIVSWCLGHLAEYAAPEKYDEKYHDWRYEDLPIIPSKWELVVSAGKKEQFEIVRKLLKRTDISFVVNACDAGREGELIFNRVYELSKSKLPVKRLWISSMEESAIREGFHSLKNGEEYKNLYQASLCRAKADWLIGMNATRAFTTTYGKLFRIGRVQTPTLTMLVERQDRIENFAKEIYYKVNLEYQNLIFTSESIKDKKEAEKMEALCNGKTAVVKEIKKEKKKSHPPKLYDLTTLQREANRYFDYTAQETLDILQKLYENKMITYPRTDSQYITEDMAKNLGDIVEKIVESYELSHAILYQPRANRVVDNAKVSDHHGILITKQAMKENWEELDIRQKNIMHLISQRILKALAEDYLYEQIEVMVACEGCLFFTKGKTEEQLGYEGVELAFQKEFFSGKRGKRNKKGAVEKREVILEQLGVGISLTPVRAKKTEHFTSPPKAYSEDTLLSSMEIAGNKEFDKETEKKGLGTPATRASIIEKLVHSKYAKREGKQIVPTQEGRELISILPDYLKSASMTAEWENQLLKIERGELSSDCFMTGIQNLIMMSLNGCDIIPQKEKNRFCKREKIGICPVCGEEVYEGKKNFYCVNRECHFSLWKENHYLESMKKILDKEMAKELLQQKKTRVKDFYSTKRNRYFEADLCMNIEDGRVNFSLEFPKKSELKNEKYKNKKMK